MEYATPYEALGDQKFQRFVQSLLSYDYPDLQAFPVGQRDGGRDAVSRLESAAKPLIFQVKYVKRVDYVKNPEEWVRTTLKHELKQISRLAEAGATHYFLITNAPGSAQDDVGSIDRVQRVLDELPLPATCFWR